MSLSKNLIIPGNFSATETSACDARRCEFDIMNDTVISNDVQVNAVLIGDSITHFFDNNVFYNDCGVVLNRGIGGDEAQFVDFRFEADVVQLRPRAAVILVGINNTWVLEDQKDENGRFKDDAIAAVVAKVSEAFESMFEKAAEADIEMWICSIMPLGEGMPTIEERNRAIRAINDEYKRLIDKHGGKYIDLYTPMCDENGRMRAECSRDGVHPNGVGYKVIADILAPMLKELNER